MTAQISEATVSAFAREYADWRLGGCPGYDFHKGFRDRLTKAARKEGVGYAVALVPVHREAYRLIDAASRPEPALA